MKLRLVILSIFIISILACNSSNEDKIEAEKYKDELNTYANEYMMGLKSVLIKNMQKGGPIQAINVCSDTASDMTAAFSEQKQVIVKRASQKNRNLDNAPDSHEERAILYFSELADNEEFNDTVSTIEKVKIDDKDAILYSKPIFVEAPCLNCHGTNEQISKEVADFLKNKYPNDKATGYKIGDLRGIISVTKIL